MRAGTGAGLARDWPSPYSLPGVSPTPRRPSCVPGVHPAVAALAGVTSTRVAVISYSLNAPATSLFGGSGRRLTAAAADALAGLAWGRRLRASDAIEVDSRIATINQADADAISARVGNATLQAEFTRVGRGGRLHRRRGAGGGIHHQPPPAL